MSRFHSLTIFLVVLLGATGMALADATVDQQPLGPDGQLFGGSISPKGEHIAVFAGKGSHYQIIVDGVEGPKIDNLIFNVAGDLYRPGTMWINAAIPVIFSKDGAHWAYMAKQADEYVVMLDGKEFARGPINPKNAGTSLNLTFSANGQHLFWSDNDAQGNFVIVVDGKPGPAMRTLPQLVLSKDGSHYAYVNYNRDGTGAWTFVDGKQVNYFGDNLQYSARNALISTMHLPDNNNVLVLNGKPEIKALSIAPMWMSDDGKQIALIITPTQGAASFLTVNGKKVDGTDGVPIEKVYFSLDGNHYAALCRTKTGAKFMIIDGKKGDEYPTIAPQVPNDSGTHWSYVTWTGNNANSSFGNLNLPVPGFTADSSKFVYVANSNGRQFLVVDSDESNAFGDTLMPVLSPVGNHIAAYAATPDHIQHILMDGKDTAYGVGPNISQLTFSPLGTHYAFLKQNYTLYLDGVVQPGVLQANYVFSPDDKHLAYEVNDGQQRMVVDGKVICDKAGVVTHIFFSPDSQHVYWTSTGNLAVLGVPGTADSIMLYVDGKPATHYSDNATVLDPITDTTASLHPEFSADDTMTFIARTDGKVRRFHVKSDTDLATILAAASAVKTK